MHYDLKCTECDSPRPDVFWPSYEDSEHVFVMGDRCRCGANTFAKDGVPLTANMKGAWENTCRRLHGRKDKGIPRPDPDARRRHADAASVTE